MDFPDNNLKLFKVYLLVITKNHFLFLKTIGKGGFGKVWKS